MARFFVRMFGYSVGSTLLAPWPNCNLLIRDGSFLAKAGRGGPCSPRARRQLVRGTVLRSECVGRSHRDASATAAGT